MDFWDICWVNIFGFNSIVTGLSYLNSRAAISDLHPPNSLASADFHFSIDGTRAANSLRASLTSRKRALSSSPYSDSFDISSMIRYSPNSLVNSLMNGSRSSSASGSYGHLSAGNLSPALGGLHAAMPPHIQHLLRTGSLLHSMPGHPLSPTSSMFSLPHHPMHSLRHSLTKTVSWFLFI